MNLAKRTHSFLNHLLHPFLGNRNQYNLNRFTILYPINFVIWLLLIPIKLIEIFGFSFLLNFIFKSLSNTRALNTFEINELKTVFKNSIDYSLIRVNESSKWAKIGSKSANTKHLGFVWMNTVNFTTTISCKNKTNDMAWLVHEMVHVAQYNKLGIQYIFEALIAQHIGGYSFGGPEQLNKNNNLNYYNLEQQADIIKLIYLDKSSKEKFYKTFKSNLINSQF